LGRHLVIAAAQMGPIARTESRAGVVRRMIDLMRQAKALGAEVVAYPEAALTAFFPHWFTEDEDEVDTWFEREMPGPDTQALFDEARRLGVGFHLGYCELDMSSGRKRRFNSSILVEASGRIIGNIARFTCRDMPITDPRPRSRTWRSAILRWATWASAPGRPGVVWPA